MTMDRVVELLERIEQAKGTTAKQELLYELLLVAEGERFLRLAFDNTVYGVSDKTFEKLIAYNGAVYFDAGELLKSHGSSVATWQLSQMEQFLEGVRASSGTALISHLKTMLVLPPLYVKWLTRIISRDMKLGATHITVNKVLHQVGKKPIEKHEVQLCGSIEDITSLTEVANAVGLPCIAAIKYDGERGFLEKHGSTVTFTSRQGKVIDYVPELLEHFATWEKDFILDGEIVGKDFSTLQKRIGKSIENIERGPDLAFVIFDVLAFDGKDLTQQSQAWRTGFIESLPVSDRCRIEEHVLIEDHAQLVAFYRAAVERKEEGIVAKKSQAPYDCGSRRNWWKVKPSWDVTMEVTGSKTGTGKNAGLISTLYVKDRSGLITSGVGSGLKEDDILVLMNLNAAGKLVGAFVDIRYRAVTVAADGSKSLRFPSFIKLRPDKDMADEIE